MNLYDILSLKFPHAKFGKDIKLCDHGLGNGIEIQEWNLDLPFPTIEDIEQWAIDIDLIYRQKLAAEQRNYPSIGDQLDMIYKDQRDGTSLWYETIAAIKAAHPKPQE